MRKILILVAFVLSCSGTQKKIEMGPNADLKRSAAAGDATGVEQAILAGADPLTKDERGRTPLHLACESGNLEAVKLLLQPKSVVAAKKSRREGVAILNYANNTGSKNYTWIGASLPDAIQGLMAENFEFKRKSAEQKAQAAVIISGSYVLEPGGKQAVITTEVITPADNTILLRNQITAPLDTNIFDALNKVAAEIVTGLKTYTSNEFAVRLKNSEQALISDINARDRGDLTPLAIAAEQNNMPLVEMLIKAGADYQTALIEAVNYGNETTAVAITNAAPDLNFRIAGGKTPLIQAAFKGRLRVVQALVSRKASTNLQDLYGFTALLYAAQEGHFEVARSLIGAQANVNIRTWDDFSALEAARRKGRTEIVEMLGTAGAK